MLESWGEVHNGPRVERSKLVKSYLLFQTHLSATIASQGLPAVKLSELSVLVKGDTTELLTVFGSVFTIKK